MNGKVALQSIFESCVSLLAYHEASALKREPEAVHQMRVSIRRMRAAAASFKYSIPKAHYRWVQKELRWITRVLGSARDIDVFQSHLLQKAAEKFPEWRGLQDPTAQARKSAYANVERAIKSPRYQGMKFALVHWLDNDDQPDGVDGALQDPLDITVPAILAQSYDRALKLTKKYDEEDKRHDLRIALKKLRYTSEIFGTIYDENAVHEFTSRLKRLQDDLGDENDVRVGREIVDKLGHRPHVSSTGHCILDWHDNRVKKHEERTVEHLDRFANTPTFWN